MPVSATHVQGAQTAPAPGRLAAMAALAHVTVRAWHGCASREQVAASGQVSYRNGIAFLARPNGFAKACLQALRLAGEDGRVHGCVG